LALGKSHKCNFEINQIGPLCSQREENSKVSKILRAETPPELLAGLKPVEAVERGQIDLVWQMVEGLRSPSQL
jgi:hypothetical protein